MPSLPTKPAGTSHVVTEEEVSKRHLDHEVRNMIAALTNRLTKLHSVTKLSGGPVGHGKDDTTDDDTARGSLGVVTLAGTNQGATMRSGLDEIDPASSEGGQNMAGAYVNSNFQAVNNSILLGGSYNAEDPGVHMVIEDYRDKKEKKKKRDVGASKDINNKELHQRKEAEE
ncbi:hypothetical protein H6P81_008303 [Aristolochia fimbriata]|uniref:Uncharacterized protein n=1 Tax=Aristolochia fimbriata TaxID=158543 RepID=A0AAV7F3C1_ARIFI|nr:hypothetical protein H6P81_008303 [Aristolochia fimbriata]